MNKLRKMAIDIKEREIYTPSYKLMLLMIKERNFVKSYIKLNHSQVWKSLFIITTFKTIESMINYLKKDVLNEQKYQDLGLSKNKLKKLNEYYIVSKNGEKIKKIKKIPFADNVTFALDMFNYTNFVFESIDKTTEDWDNFEKAIKIRNRIVHPRFLKDIHISKKNLEIVDNAYNWFFDTFDEFHRKGAESLIGQSKAIIQAAKGIKN